MTKTELKENITKITQILQSENYEAGVELIITLDNPEITEATFDAVVAKVTELLEEQDSDEWNYSGIELAKKINETEIFEAITSLEFTDTDFPPFMDKFKNLNSLYYGYCDHPDGYIWGVDECSKLEHLTLEELPNQQDMGGIPMQNLKTISITYLDFLYNLDDFVDCKKLTDLYINNAFNLENVDGIANIENLKYLLFSECYNIQPKPSRSEMTTREEVAAYQEEIKKAMK